MRQVWPPELALSEGSVSEKVEKGVSKQSPRLKKRFKIQQNSARFKRILGRNRKGMVCLSEFVENGAAWVWSSRAERCAGE